MKSSNGVMAPLIALAAIYALAHEWPQELWNWVYTHVAINNPGTDSPVAPINTNQIGTAGPGAGGLNVGPGGTSLPPNSPPIGTASGSGAISSILTILGIGTGGKSTGNSTLPSGNIGTSGPGSGGLQIG